MVKDIYKKDDYPQVVMPQQPVRQVLKGQKAMVTGAISGIGKATALALSKAGAAVVINYVKDDGALSEMLKEIKQQGGEAFGFQADVSKEDQVEAMFAEMFKQFGTINILVNNAGLQKDAPFDQMTLA